MLAAKVGHTETDAFQARGHDGFERAGLQAEVIVEGPGGDTGFPAPARALAKIPNGQTWEEAAATWSAFGTAWCGLVEMARLSPGQVVIITAASSSVGLAAIQIARASAGIAPAARSRRAPDLA